MLKRVVLAALAAVSLAGCQAPAPDPAFAAMSAQCQAGNQAACANYAAMQQAHAARAQALMSNWQNPQPTPYVMTGPPAPTYVYGPTSSPPYAFGPGWSPYY